MAKHTHKFIRVKNSKTGARMWKCALEGCSWFVHEGLAHLIPGKLGICWKCEEPFLIDEFIMREDKPMCPECRPFTPRVQVEEPDQVEVIETIDDEEESAKQFDISMTKLYGTKDWKKYLK